MVGTLYGKGLHGLFLQHSDHLFASVDDLAKLEFEAKGKRKKKADTSREM
jgi:hypothetical protein